MNTATETDSWPRLLDGYTPRYRWHDEPATPKQIEALERRGYLPPENVTKGQAAFALNRATPKQLALTPDIARTERSSPQGFDTIALCVRPRNRPSQPAMSAFVVARFTPCRVWANSLRSLV